MLYSIYKSLLTLVNKLTLVLFHTVTVVRGVPGTRRRGTSFEHFIVTQNIEIAGEQVHTKMTLILDKDTGNTEDL